MAEGVDDPAGPAASRATSSENALFTAQSGPLKYRPSISWYGTPNRPPKARASVDLPAPVTPTTKIRSTSVHPIPGPRGAGGG